MTAKQMRKMLEDYDDHCKLTFYLEKFNQGNEELELDETLSFDEKTNIITLYPKES